MIIFSVCAQHNMNILSVEKIIAVVYFNLG